MTDRIGHIISINDGIAAIRVEPASACSACATRNVCAGGRDDRSLVYLPVTSERAGDRVVLRLADGGLTRAALLADLLPALTTLSGGLLLSSAGDLAAVAGALSGLGLGLLALRRVSRRRAGCDRPAVLPAPTISQSIGEAS